MLFNVWNVLLFCPNIYHLKDPELGGTLAQTFINVIKFLKTTEILHC